MLNEKGQCCGRKPIVYKRPDHHLFCDRCDRSYDGKTLNQVSNWAWDVDQSGEFVARFPERMKLRELSK